VLLIPSLKHPSSILAKVPWLVAAQIYPFPLSPRLTLHSVWIGDWTAFRFLPRHYMIAEFTPGITLVSPLYLQLPGHFSIPQQGWEVSRRETLVTSVGADDGNKNIIILLRNMFSVKHVRSRKISRCIVSMRIASRGTRIQRAFSETWPTC
jgi:hypothetical protein